MKVFLIPILFTLTVAPSALLRATTVSGRIVDTVGRPFMGARISISGSSAFVRETKSDSAGRFQFAEVPAGTYSLEVCCGSGAAPLTQKIVVGEGRPQIIELVTERLVEIWGRVTVLGDTTQPDKWYGARVEATRVAGKRLTLGASVRPDGRFVLPLPRGEYRIDLNTPDTYEVRSITFGGNDLRKEPVTVDSSSSSMIVIIVAVR
jgi:hypothetical protein